nr:MAG: putative RNA-dependent RNA polymerase [Picobirnavirus sp.]
MKETKLQSNELTVVQNNNGLKMYLSGLSVGREATPRSNLYNLEGKTELLAPDTILDEWKRQLSILDSGTDFERNVFQFDSAQLQKWGPQGQIAPISELMDEIVLPTFSLSERHPAFDTEEWRWAKRQVVRNLHSAGCVGLSPVPYKRVVDDMRARDTLESNSGWPLFTRRNKPEVITQSIEEAENGQWKTYPAIALFRNYNRKTRLVWMFPMSANLVEGSFFQPLQSKLMKSRFARQFLSPWNGFETVRSQITAWYQDGVRIVNHTNAKHAKGELFLAASDFSGTDEHFKLDASLEVCSVLEKCFQPRYRMLLRESICYMHEIPLVISPTEKLTGEHGVASGSNWTNFIETIFDWILQYYIMAQYDNMYMPGYAIGDDMTWCLYTYDEDFAFKLEDWCEGVGQVVKAEKTTNDPDKVKSLQRLFQRDYLRPDGQVRAVYSTIRALKSLVYPERFHKPELWSKDMEAIRAFMILENCVDHPLFHQFCEFVSKGDPNLKTFAKLSERRQNELLRKSKLIPGLNPTYNQEKRDSSISQFQSVKFIAQLG